MKNRRIQETYIFCSNCGGNLLNLCSITKTSDLHTKGEWQRTTFPFCILIRCLSCVNDTLVTTGFSLGCSFIEQCHMVHTKPPALHSLALILRVKVVGNLPRAQRFIKGRNRSVPNMF